MRIDLGPTLDALRAQLLAQVDADAEAARLRWITPGMGQMLEYQATEAEARAYLAAGCPAFDPAAHPFLAADRQAMMAAGADLPDAATVAHAVIAAADAWRAAAAEIKRLRRAAKLGIAGATSVAQARAAALVAWPSPDHPPAG